jgi:hypothetical protein
LPRWSNPIPGGSRFTRRCSCCFLCLRLRFLARCGGLKPRAPTSHASCWQCLVWSMPASTPTPALRRAPSSAVHRTSAPPSKWASSLPSKVYSTARLSGHCWNGCVDVRRWRGRIYPLEGWCAARAGSVDCGCGAAAVRRSCAAVWPITFGAVAVALGLLEWQSLATIKEKRA